MTCLRPLLLAVALSAVCVPSASAIVGGTDVPAGQRGYVAYITIDRAFACTGTLVTPRHVVTAAHCSSITGAVNGGGTPIGQPGQLIEVTLGSVRAGQGERPGVKAVNVHPDYIFLNGNSNDVAVLELSAPSTQRPVPLAAPEESALWKAGTLAQIAGFGLTESEGEAPDVMQQAQVPIAADATSMRAYPDSFEAETQIGAGYPEGGTDSCQGDSGGPLLVPAPDGSLRLVGDTSYGDGCAQPNLPGIYGRVAGPKLRAFVLSKAPGSIAPAPKAAVGPTQPGGAPSTASPTAGSAPAASGTAPSSGATKAKPKARRSCAALHKRSAKFNKTKKYRKLVKACQAKRRAQLTPR